MTARELIYQLQNLINTHQITDDAEVIVSLDEARDYIKLVGKLETNKDGTEVWIEGI